MTKKRRKQPAKQSAAKPAAPAKRRGFAEAWNAFFFAARDRRLCDVLRAGYGVLLLVNLAVWARDLERWFGEDGVLPLRNARLIVDEHAPTLLAHLPLPVCFALLVASAILLTLGFYSRVNAVLVLVWLTSFHDRNIAIVDGEDTVFRLFAFFLALCPRRGDDESEPWALRLFQLQIAVIYLSSAIEKTTSSDWTNGSALYYVARLDDWFGKLPVPAFAFESPSLVHAMTWATLALEWILPVLLFVPRTRKWAVVVGIAFHLSIDWTMNLFLFHYLMILGLLAFLEYDELARPFRKLKALLRGGRPAAPPA